MIIELQSHPGEEVLERYSLGHLNDSELDRVEEHLFVCERCQDQLVHVEQFISEVKRACQDYRLQPAPRPSWWARFNEFLAVPKLVYGGAAAAFVLALVLPLAWYQPDGAAPDTITWNVTYRGNDTGVVEAHAKRPLHLVMNIADLPVGPTYQVQIVDQDGRIMWTGNPGRAGNQLMVQTSERFASGIYWVRLFGADGNPVREFGLHLK